MEFKRVFRKFLEMYWEETFLLVAALFAAGMLLCPESTIFWVSWLCVVLVFLGVAYSLWRKFRRSVRETEWEKEQRDCRKNSDPIFLEDKEIEDERDDKLGIAEDAWHFGEQVLNGGSDNPMVFGLDAAWGSGKSSFLNLCEKGVWETKENKKKVAVFTFKPVLYDASIQDIAGIFIGEFSSFLKKEKISFDGLGRDGKMLARLVSGVSVGGDFLGVNFRFPQESLDSVLGKIKDRIKLLPRRVIVIVDDLDRLYLEEVKAILGVVRNIFNIPKISFVLCYDTSNINSFEIQKKIVRTESYGDNRIGNNLENKGDEEVEKKLYSRAEHEPDNERLNAYFEKIIQVKKTLIPNREKLKSFFVGRIKSLFVGCDELNCKRFLDGIEYFFQADTYPRYTPFIGDIRKIKRILNFIYVSGFVESMKNDFSYRDIDSRYLLQLVLVYINYPHLFRKIYTEETGGSFGFFSVIPNRGGSDGNSLGFANSSRFLNFLKAVSVEQRFLLEELFLVQKKFDKSDLSGKNPYREKITSDEFQRYSTFFNGGYFFRENLNDYMKIIYDGQLLPLWRYDNFHLNKIKNLEQRDVQEIFNTTLEYGANMGEEPRDIFFKKAHVEFISFSSAEKIIEYIVSNLSHYSMVSEFSGVYEGIRDELVLHWLPLMLESRGWKDRNGNSYENSDENVAVLAERIFGSDQYPSLVDTLLESGSNSILSVNDAIRFVYACTDTGPESLFNVRRSLENYAKNESINVMETLSRKAFQFFYEHIIQEKKNFLREIVDMEETLLFGDFSKAIWRTFNEKKKNLKEEVEKIKNRLGVKLVFEFACAEERSMGMYSFDISSSKKIFEVMRDYLFDVCFNIDVDSRNAELFINFALASLKHELTMFDEWVPNIPFLEKAFGSDRLRDYWRENGERIKNSGRAMLSTAPEKKVVTYNYVATYREHMEKLFGKLDEFMKGKDF